jgi:hypothetical protein
MRGRVWRFSPELLLCASACLVGCSASTSAETVPPDLLAEPAADPSGGDDLFGDCRASREGRSTSVLCSSFGLAIESSEESNFEAILDDYIREHVYAATDDVESETSVQAYQLSVAGTDYPGRRFRRTSRAVPSSAAVGFVVIAQARSGEVLSLACSSRELVQRETDLENTCRTAIAHIVAHGVPEALFTR